METKKMFMDGKWVDAISGRTEKILNPYNSDVIAVVASGDDNDSKKAIAAARNAFDNGEWPHLTGEQRGKYLHRIYELVIRDHEELSRLESLDTGKTVEESRWDMDGIAEVFRYYGDLAGSEKGTILDSPFPGTASYTVREPVGVCGQISPWNYPLLQASWKMAPALAAGCTIVMKPSEITPLTTIKITELAQEAGIPTGVVNLVLGTGPSVGAELARSHDVDLISFTGGLETGKFIMQAAAGNVKKIALELGGKNPNIVFADSDLDTALDYALNAVFFHAGQICSAGSRLLVEKSIHDDFVEKLAHRMKKIVLGSGFDEDTQMGPLISEAHRQTVEEYVALAHREGAALITGGKRPDNPELARGFFYLPTLFTNCRTDMEIVQEESFGPIITVETFRDEAEALRLANDTKYGLAAGFWSQDPGKIHRMSKGLRFGTVWVNDFNVYYPRAPWGGYKQSGVGRELSHEGFHEYCEVKHIYQNFQTQAMNWFGK